MEFFPGLPSVPEFCLTLHQCPSPTGTSWLSFGVANEASTQLAGKHVRGGAGGGRGPRRHAHFRVPVRLYLCRCAPCSRMLLQQRRDVRSGYGGGWPPGHGEPASRRRPAALATPPRFGAAPSPLALSWMWPSHCLSAEVAAPLLGLVGEQR